VSLTSLEIDSQAKTWPQAVIHAQHAPQGLPIPGESVAVVGCGTSVFIGESYARLREEAGQGVTDAHLPTEFPWRDYDRVILLSRSGTTTEVERLAQELAERGIRTVLITSVAGGPIAPHVATEIVLDYAGEQSVVQTRFATSAWVFLTAALGIDTASVVSDVERALAWPLDPDWVRADQITFLGEGLAIGLAHEAALKCREASQSWTESYSAMDYRHGPISIARPGRVVFFLGAPPAGLVSQISQTGADSAVLDLEPLAALVVAQRLAVARSQAAGFDPDRPRNLTRAVILGA